MPTGSRWFIVACFGMLFGASTVQADNWERFRGPNGTGISADKNIPIKFSATENVRWKVAVPGDGNSSPIVWGDHLFMQSASLDGSQRFLICFDTNSGKELWQRSIPGVKVKLRADSSLASATATTDGERVFVPFWNGKDIIMMAYDFKGNKLWEHNLGEFVSQHGAGASPILYKDLLIFSMDKDAFRDANKKIGPVDHPSTLYALDKRTGKIVWEAPREAIRACYTMPFILERPGSDPELLVTSTTAITSYEPMSGKSNWYWTWTFAKDPLRTIGGTTYVDDTVLAVSGDGSGERLMVAVALKGQGKHVQPVQAWSNKKEFPYMTCPVVKGPHVYFVNDLGVAGCFVAKTGKKVWFERMQDAKFYASPLLIDGKIFAASEQGDVFVMPAEPKFDVISRNPLGEVIRATPAVANGRLYIRGQKHLFCIEKTP